MSPSLAAPFTSEVTPGRPLPAADCTWDWAVLAPLTPERRELLDELRAALPPGLEGLVASGLPRAEQLQLARRARVTIELPGDVAVDAAARLEVPRAGGLLLEHVRERAASGFTWTDLGDLRRQVERCREDAVRDELAWQAHAEALAHGARGGPFRARRVAVAGFELYTRTEQGGDLDVLREVIEDDAYGLRGLTGLDLRTIVDVGAHVGAFSLLAKRLFPAARLIAVEPNPRSAELLRHNLAGLPGVEVHEAAVRYDGADVLTASLGASASGFMAPADRVDELLPPNFQDRLWRCRAVGRVPTVTLEELAQGAPIDLLKLDCEGSEHDILSRASDALLSRCGLVLGELHDARGHAPFEALLRRRLPGHQVEVERGKAISLFSCRPRHLLPGVDR